MVPDETHDRLHALALRWRVTLRRVRQTTGSVLGFGDMAGRRVVLKVARSHHEEWTAGDVIAAFAGRGMVRALAHEPGAVLLERLEPGTSLFPLVHDGRDPQALGTLAGVIATMQETAPPPCAGLPTALEWARAFDGFRSAGRAGLDDELVDAAQRTYVELCRSQQHPRLLHGDLHYENVLLDHRRGWLAIDPKGVVAEREFELGAVLRNPDDRPELHGSAALEQRATLVASMLGLDVERTLRWTFAQAVLSAIWTIEDGGLPDAAGPALRVAAAARVILT